MGIAGLLLAAGRGSRFGGPKALAHIDGRPFLHIALDALEACAPMFVVVGAAGADVSKLLPDNVFAVRADRWRDGIGASLRAGLAAVADIDADAVLIHLVDLPDVDRAVVARLLERSSESVLARATYNGRIGHPVLVGRAWWAELQSSLGDGAGAGEFLRERAERIECADLASGVDVDTAADLRRFPRRAQ